MQLPNQSASLLRQHRTLVSSTLSGICVSVKQSRNDTPVNTICWWSMLFAFFVMWRSTAVARLTSSAIKPRQTQLPDIAKGASDRSVRGARTGKVISTLTGVRVCDPFDNSTTRRAQTPNYCQHVRFLVKDDATMSWQYFFQSIQRKHAVLERMGML